MGSTSSGISGGISRGLSSGMLSDWTQPSVPANAITMPDGVTLVTMPDGVTILLAE